MSITGDRAAKQGAMQPVFGFAQRLPAPVVIGQNGGGIESLGSATLVSRPVGIATGDIELVAIQTQTGQPGTISTAGWTQVPTVSPQDSGAGGCDLAVYWHLFTSGDAEPTINDSGDHQVAYNFAIRGAGLGGRNPIAAAVGSTEAASTNVNVPSITTPAWNCLVVAFAAVLRDANASDNFFPAAVLSSRGTQLGKIFDRTSSIGTGGGFGMFAGVKAEPGPTGIAVCPHNTLGSVSKATIVLALR